MTLQICLPLLASIPNCQSKEAERWGWTFHCMPKNIKSKKVKKHFITKHKIHHLYPLITTHDDFSSADPSSIQNTCHKWTQLNDFALHEFSSSVNTAPTRCSGGHGFDSCWGLRFFFVTHLYHVDQFTFHISLPSLKCTIFIHLISSWSTCNNAMYGLVLGHGSQCTLVQHWVVCMDGHILYQSFG